MDLTVDLFQREIATALENYEKYIVCLDKTQEQCKISLNSLLRKAIDTYLHRGPNLRHGIALDRQITVILSQTDGERPLCGIYFNLFTPYHVGTPH